MKVIITTCQDRREHLAVALESWRGHLPDWTPLLVAVDDQRAVDLLAERYAGREWLSVSVSQSRFCRLPAIVEGIDALPPQAGSVAILDADIVALAHSRGWFESPVGNGFRIVKFGDYFCKDDFGVLMASADTLRRARELLGDVSDWQGYGWEDVCLRCACWIVTGGNIQSAQAQWAHIPHKDDLRSARTPNAAALTEQARANYVRLVQWIEAMAAQAGLADWRSTTLWADCTTYPVPLPHG